MSQQLKKKCETCHKLFVKPPTCGLPEWKLRRFCSKSCGYKALIKPPLVVNCDECGKRCEFKWYDQRKKEKKYCSRSCSGRANNRQGIKSRGHSAVWRGGRITSEQGYTLIWTGKRYEFEHRLKMAEKIGRRLKPKEVVHHKNGKRNDNRLCNLKLFASNAEHKRYEHLCLRSN